MHTGFRQRISAHTCRSCRLPKYNWIPPDQRYLGGRRSASWQACCQGEMRQTKQRLQVALGDTQHVLEQALRVGEARVVKSDPSTTLKRLLPFRLYTEEAPHTSRSRRKRLIPVAWIGHSRPVLQFKIELLAPLRVFHQSRTGG